MHAAFLSTFVSALALAFFVGIFNLEHRRGARYFSRVREGMDSGAQWLFGYLAKGFAFFGRDVLRRAAHGTFNRVLQFLLGCLHTLEYYVGRLMHTNSTIAKKGERKTDGPQTKLDEIAQHKVSTTLSEEERRKHKEHSVGTRL